MKLRYLKMDLDGTVQGRGPRLMDVECMGVGIIVDFKLNRWAYTGTYPATFNTWHIGFDGVGDLLRTNKKDGGR